MRTGDEASLPPFCDEASQLLVDWMSATLKKPDVCAPGFFVKSDWFQRRDEIIKRRTYQSMSATEANSCSDAAT